MSSPVRVVDEGEMFRVCANFAAVPLQRNVSVELVISDEYESK